MVATGPEDPAMVVANLRRLMNALQGSASERAGMEEAMKEMKKGDNVLPKLMASAPQVCVCSHDCPDCRWVTLRKKVNNLDPEPLWTAGSTPVVWLLFCGHQLYHVCWAVRERESEGGEVLPKLVAPQVRFCRRFTPVSCELLLLLLLPVLSTGGWTADGGT